jgi:DNA-binding CsgD family transcriptional regulator
MGRPNKEQLVIKYYEMNIDAFKTLKNTDIYRRMSYIFKINERTVRNHLNKSEMFLRINKLKKEYGIPNSKVGRKTKEEIVLEYYKEHPYAKPSKIAQEIGVSKPTVIKYLKKFKKEIF